MASLPRACLLLALCCCGTAADGDPAKTGPGASALLMADYRGLSPGSTKSARLAEFANLDGVKSVSIHVYARPARITVEDPQLTDGDNGFVWTMSLEQLMGLVIARVKAKDALTVTIDEDAGPDAKAIRAWFDSIGFATVAFK